MTHNLRACDLVPGRLYWSPTGRKCVLQAPQDNGISNTSFLFTYLKSDGTPYADDGFAISDLNKHAIAALQEVV